MKSSMFILLLVCFSVQSVYSNSNPWEVKKLTKNQIVNLEGVNFDSDQSTLSLESKAAISQLKDFLLNNKSVIIELQGHTNNVPSHEYCDELSNQRANSIRNYLIEQGVNPKNLIAKGYGKRKSIASNLTSVGRETNQRVDVMILSF